MTASPTCINCAYPLNNLAATGVCPECGTPLAASKRVEHLRESSLEYLCAVRTGLWLKVVGMLEIFAVVPEEIFNLNPAAARAADLVALGFTLLSCGGSWLIASSDPGRVNDAAFTRLTVRARAWAIVAAAAEIVEVLQLMALRGTVSSLLGTVCSLMSTAASIYVWRALANLARRSANERLARRPSGLVTIAIASLVATAIGSALELAMHTPGVNSTILDVGLVVFLLLLCLLMLAYLIRSIQVTIGLLRELRAAISHQRALAAGTPLA